MLANKPHPLRRLSHLKCFCYDTLSYLFVFTSVLLNITNKFALQKGGEDEKRNSFILLQFLL